MSRPGQTQERQMRARLHRLEQPLQPILGARARVLVLGLLMLHPRQGFYVREIAYLTGLRVRAVERQLKRLLGAELVTRREGRVKVFYQCNRRSPLARSLRQLCWRAIGT